MKKSIPLSPKDRDLDPCDFKRKFGRERTAEESVGGLWEPYESRIARINGDKPR